MNENNRKEIKINQNTLKWIIIGLAAFVVVILIFGAGIFIGGIKARFSYRWAESYHKNFAGPKGGFLDDWQKLPTPPGNFIESHGVFGEIIKINDSDLVIKGRDDVEKIVLIKEDTLIKRLNKTIKPIELKVDDFIVIIGEPNNSGQIEAKFIRIMPPPPKETSSRPLKSSFWD